MLGDSVTAFAFSFSVLFPFFFGLSAVKTICLEIVEAVLSHSTYFQIEYYLGNDQNSCFLFLVWILNISSHGLQKSAENLHSFKCFFPSSFTFFWCHLVMHALIIQLTLPPFSITDAALMVWFNAILIAIHSTFLLDLK